MCNVLAGDNGKIMQQANVCLFVACARYVLFVAVFFTDKQVVRRLRKARAGFGLIALMGRVNYAAHSAGWFAASAKDAVRDNERYNQRGVSLARRRRRRRRCPSGWLAGWPLIKQYLASGGAPLAR